MANLLATRTDHQLEWHQIQHLYKKDERQLLISQGMSDPSRGTVVDRLLAFVSNDPTMSYVMLFAEKKSDLLTIKQKQVIAKKNCFS